MKSYLETLDYSKVSSLEDIVQFNKDHANKELPKGRLSLHDRTMTNLTFNRVLKPRSPCGSIGTNNGT